MSSKAKHVPLRTCSICRLRGSKYDLIRIVRSPDGQPVIDIAGKLPGRGVYICTDPECIAKARKSGKLAPSANSKFWSELDDYAKSFAADKNINLNSKQLRSILGLARKAGVLLIGVDNIKNSRINKILVITASDCSDSVKRFAGAYQTLPASLSIQELSEAVGSSGKGIQIAALPMSSGFAKKLLAKNFERSLIV